MFAFLETVDFGRIDILWNFLWVVYDAGLFIAIMFAAIGTTIFLSTRLVITFKYYLDRGEYDDFDMWEIDNTHPIGCITGTIVIACANVVAAFIWPLTLLYFAFHGAAKFTRKSIQRKNSFLSRLAGEKREW